MTSNPLEPGRSAGKEHLAASGRLHLICGAALFLLAFALFSPTLQYEFVWDDLSLLLSNPRLGDWSMVWENLTSNVFQEAQERGGFDYWRPLVVVSHMVEKSVFHDTASGFHAVNAVLHATVSLLVFSLGLRVFRNTAPALTAALIFAVHPAHVEVVAWVSGRSDLLFGLLFVAALAADWKAASEGPSVLWRAATVLAFAGALLAKETAAVIPFLIAVRVWITSEPGSRLSELCRRTWSSIWPSLLVFGSYLWIRFGVLGAAAPPLATDVAGRDVLFWTWWKAVLEYFRILVWPTRLSIVHEIQPTSGPGSASVLAGFLLLTASCWLVVRLRRRAPGAAYGIAILLVGLAPLSNFVFRIGSHPGTVFPFAERFLYVPSTGFCLFVGWWLMDGLPVFLTRATTSQASHHGVIRRGLSLVPWFAVALVVAAGAYASLQRSAIWSDELTLFRATVQDHPDNALAHLNYGVALERQSRLQVDQVDKEEFLMAALRHYQRARELAPTNYRGHYNLGNLYLALGNYGAAESSYRIALDLYPDLLHAAMNLGILLAQSDRLEEALRLFEQAERLAPELPATKVNRANTLALLGRHQEAIRSFEAALELDPNSAAAKFGLQQARAELEASIGSTPR